MGALAAAETPFDSEAVFPVSLPLPTPTPLAENTAAELFSPLLVPVTAPADADRGVRPPRPPRPPAAPGPNPPSPPSPPPADPKAPALPPLFPAAAPPPGAPALDSFPGAAPMGDLLGDGGATGSVLASGCVLTARLPTADVELIVTCSRPLVSPCASPPPFKK